MATAELFTAYDRWQAQPSRINRTAFEDACGWADPRRVIRWINSPWGQAARAA